MQNARSYDLQCWVLLVDIGRCVCWKSGLWPVYWQCGGPLRMNLDLGMSHRCMVAFSMAISIEIFSQESMSLTRRDYATFASAHIMIRLGCLPRVPLRLDMVSEFACMVVPADGIAVNFSLSGGRRVPSPLPKISAASLTALLPITVFRLSCARFVRSYALSM
jgi:hypothetical protein